MGASMQRSGGTLIDTHALGGSLTPSSDTHVLSGSDTHAADVTNNAASGGETALGATEPTGDDRGTGYAYLNNTSEQLMIEDASFTPTTAENIVFVNVRCGHFNAAGSVLHTARARLDNSTGTLIASGSQTLGAGASGWITISGTIADVSAALHDIAFTTQAATANTGHRALYHWARCCDSGSLTGSDTHALGGSYVAEVDTHALTGSASCS